MRLFILIAAVAMLIASSTGCNSCRRAFCDTCAEYPPAVSSDPFLSDGGVITEPPILDETTPMPR